MPSIVILTLRFYNLQDRHSDLMFDYLLMFLSGLEIEAKLIFSSDYSDNYKYIFSEKCILLRFGVSIKAIFCRLTRNCVNLKWE